jgi:ABC-type antimicrobial peptide transport system permease subunit
MLQNYIITALRNFRKYKGYTSLNILGLTIGITCSLLIMLWITDELSVDKFHKKDARLYQMLRNMHQSDGTVITTESVPQPVKALLETKYSEVDKVTLIGWENEFLFQKDEKIFREKGRYVSPEFFEVFSFPLVSGDPATAMKDIHSIVISESLAKKYFTSVENALGQPLRINNAQDFNVTGIFKDLPKTSSLQLNWVIPVEEFISRNDWVESWFNGGFSIAFTLKEGTDVSTFAKKIEQEVNEHTNHEADERLIFQKYSDRYLHSTFENGVSTGGRIDYVRLFIVVAIFMIVIACVNFMNLATARSLRRAQEIGIRKVMGAGKLTLGLQFLSEAITISFISVFLSILAVMLLLPYFNQFTSKQIIVDLDNPLVWMAILAVAIVTGLLSGSYPALILPSFKLTNSLKGTLKHSSAAQFFRKGLVVFQFSISILLIVGTIAVYRQMDYIMSKNLGVDKENLVFMEMEGEMGTRFETYKSELLKIQGIQSVTSTSGNPLSNGQSSGSATWEGKPADEEVEINVLTVGYDFRKTMKTEMLQGRDFSSEFGTDSSNYIINEEAAKIMGFKNPIGEALSLWDVKGQVIGVVKNFHMTTLYEPIAPLIIRFHPKKTWMTFIRIDGRNTQEVLQSIEKVTKQFNTSPFRYNFLDETYAKAYRSEQVVSSLTGIFAGIVIFISCLGLLGLSSFSAEQRTKEIGIRKVHGADVTKLVLLLSKDYAFLILFAFLIASPFAYYFTTAWLNRFTFRTELGAIEFFIAGLSIFSIAFFTVAIKSYQAASANPVDTLREK